MAKFPSNENSLAECRSCLHIIVFWLSIAQYCLSCVLILRDRATRFSTHLLKDKNSCTNYFAFGKIFA